MNDNAISPINFKYFAELPPITHLSAKRCSLDDQALKYIGQIKSLEILGLTKNSNVTDEGLKNLRQLKHLHVLEISDTKVTGPGLEQLKALPLQDLEVSPLVFEASAKKLHATFPHARITSSKTGKVTPEQKVLYAPFHY
jgi:hypothetical protein